MAKERPAAESEEKRLKKEKKKERKRSESEGVHKSSSSSKSKDKSEKESKKHKKDRRDKKLSPKDIEDDEQPLPPTSTSEEAAARKTANAVEDVQMTTELLNSLKKEKPGSVAVVKGDEDGSGDVLEVKVKNAEKSLLIGALVPFAHPLADEKVGRKVLKGVKRAAKNKTLKRGVKEVVKALRKSPPSTSTSTSSLPTAVVILAADISPMDVISHLPVLCEDHGIPYVFVTSRVELGAASSTKRPTSVVMVSRDKGGKDKGKSSKEGKESEEGKEEQEGEEWEEVYADLVKVVVKAGKGVRL